MEQTAPVPALDTIQRAYHRAVRDLRACYNPDGIVAGRLHFNAYWSGDGFFASLGALTLRGLYAKCRIRILKIRYGRQEYENESCSSF